MKNLILAAQEEHVVDCPEQYKRPRTKFERYKVPAFAEFEGVLSTWVQKEIISKATYENIKLVYDRYMQDASQVSQADFYWLDTIRRLPLTFSNEAAYKVDYTEAAKIINGGIFGKDVIKDTILNYVLASNNNETTVAPTIFAWGAPGTGKTTMGKVWAQALNRTFSFVSCAGVSESVFFKGSSRVWVGAQPGVFVKAVIDAGCMNPGIMLDELEKAVGRSSNSADPTLPLYAVLDPEQNREFVDDYLGFPIDLSKCAFFATGNGIGNLQPALLDRMTVVYIPGYTKMEKMQMWCVYIYDMIMEKYSIPLERARITEEAKQYLVDYYSPEQGTRQLEKVYGDIVLNAMKTKAPEPITQAFCVKVLGLKKPEIPRPYLTPAIGIAAGVFTPVLNNVSAMICNVGVEYSSWGNSYYYMGAPLSNSLISITSRVAEIADKYGADNGVLETSLAWSTGRYYEVVRDQLLGLASAVALFSLWTSNPVKGNCCFVGEVDALGVLQYVDNLQFQIQTASSVGVDTIYVPKANEVEAIEYKNLGDIKLVFCDTLEEVFEQCFVNTVNTNKTKEVSYE